MRLCIRSPLIRDRSTNTSLFLINTMSGEEINVLLLFSAGRYNETAGLYGRATFVRRVRIRVDPNELTGIHTDVALSPPKGSRR